MKANLTDVVFITVSAAYTDNKMATENYFYKWFLFLFGYYNDFHISILSQSTDCLGAEKSTWLTHTLLNP